MTPILAARLEGNRLGREVIQPFERSLRAPDDDVDVVPLGGNETERDLGELLAQRAKQTGHDVRFPDLRAG